MGLTCKIDPDQAARNNLSQQLVGDGIRDAILELDREQDFGELRLFLEEITHFGACLGQFFAKLRIFCRNILQIQKIPLHLHSQNDGAIAQLVEQRTENPCVPGSIPGGTTKKITNS